MKLLRFVPFVLVVSFTTAAFADTPKKDGSSSKDTSGKDSKGDAKAPTDKKGDTKAPAKKDTAKDTKDPAAK